MEVTPLQLSFQHHAAENNATKNGDEVKAKVNSKFFRNLTHIQPEKEEVIGNAILGKDDFLKILMTQLQNQDPSKPMEDKEFIAQMAQFSSLEQITNMSKGFENLQRAMGRNFALSLIGKTVAIQPKDADAVHGVVSEVLTGEKEQVKVNGVMYNSDDIIRVRATEVE